MKYQRYIEFILFDSPTEEELQKFNNELITNSVLKEEYEIFLTALGRINTIEDSIKNDVKSMSDFEFDPDIEESIQAYRKDSFLKRTERKAAGNHRDKKETENIPWIRNKRGWFKAVAVLTIFILLPSAFVLSTLYSKKNIIDINKLDCPKYSPFLTRSITATPVLVLKTIDCFLKGHPDSALVYMSDKNIAMLIKESDPLFKPVCLMEVGKPEEAARLLSEINSDDLNYSEAQWHLAICNLMLGKKQNASEILKKLKTTDPAFSKAANKILKEIKHHREITIVFTPSKYFTNKLLTGRANN
jgi:hypothetical protein